eukprot:m51a1_g491 putative guanine nucleotide-binding protein g subunit alpha (400) ;mRNA; f:234253-235846
MGNKVSAELLSHIAIEREIAADAIRKQRSPTYTVLLLGTEGAGKSTLLLHARALRGERPLAARDLRDGLPAVHDTALGAIKAALGRLGDGAADAERVARVAGARDVDTARRGGAERRAAAEALCRGLHARLGAGSPVALVGQDLLRRVLYEGDPGAVGTALARDIRELWASPAVRSAFDDAERDGLCHHNAAQLLDEIERIADPAFVPTLQHVLRARSRTDGLVEQRAEVDGACLRIVDVGFVGEWRKWINCFEGVDAVIFVANISQYDTPRYDCWSNAMFEALSMWRHVCCTSWFRSSELFLVFSHCDVFQQKLQRTHLSVCFPEFKAAGLSFEESLKGVEDQFRSHSRERPFRVFHSVLVDPDSVLNVLSSITSKLNAKTRALTSPETSLSPSTDSM